MGDKGEHRVFVDGLLDLIALLNGVKPAFIEGVAAQYPPKGQYSAFNDAFLLNGVKSILRTCRTEAAIAMGI